MIATIDLVRWFYFIYFVCCFLGEGGLEVRCYGVGSVVFVDFYAGGYRWNGRDNPAGANFVRRQDADRRAAV